MKRGLNSALMAFGVLLVLACLYTYPAASFLITGVNDRTVSDGTDAATLPYQYAVVTRVLRENPSYLLYGAIPDEHGTAPDPTPLWMSWIERVSVVLLHPFFSVEQLSSAVVIFLLVLDGLCFFLLGRSLGWPTGVSLALAICWAFNPFNRGRAKVHHSMVATYFLPLAFWAFLSLRSAKSLGSYALIVGALILSAMGPHYFLIMTGFIAPMISGFAFLGLERSKWVSMLQKVLLVSLPAILLVGWSFLKPLPGHLVHEGAILRPTTGDAKDSSGVHPFMKTFSARPIDYFGGDVAIGVNDINPLKELVNREIADDRFGGANEHERANGIRWLIFVALVLAIQKKRLGKEGWFFLALACVGFLISLRPDLLGGNWMPSAWIHKLVPQFRVPNRAGIFVHFGLLMITGNFLIKSLYQFPKQKRNQGWRPFPSTSGELIPLKRGLGKWLTIPAALPLLAILEFPPFMNEMPVAPILPKYTWVADPSNKSCGAGIYFPYVSHDFALREMYYFMQRMRGSSCDFINGSGSQDRNEKLLNNFALVQKTISEIESNDPGLRRKLIEFVKCSPLEWLIFDYRVPRSWSQSLCSDLGWVYENSEVCRVQEHQSDLRLTPEKCL